MEEVEREKLAKFSELGAGMNDDIILKVEGLTHRYGDFIALKDVSLEVGRGCLTALIGPNGAGKTTFYNVISGRFKPSEGRIFFDRREITGMEPYKLSAMGLSRSFQITNIFSDLTVLENVMVPIVLHQGKGFHLWSILENDVELKNEALKVLDMVGLSDVADRPARELAYGDKRLIEVGIVLASQPRLVLLDEPTAGMNPEETEQMIHLIRNLAQKLGTTFFLTEHDMKVVFSIAEYIYVLHQGQLLAKGTPEQIKENIKVREAYLGGTIDSGVA